MVRAAITTAWERDLRAIREGKYDCPVGNEAWFLLERFYAEFAQLVLPIRMVWAPNGGLVHANDKRDQGGPGVRVSQTRIRLWNQGQRLRIEGFRCVSEDGAISDPNLGLDMEIDAAALTPGRQVESVFRTLVRFIQVALDLDLELEGDRWLYEQIAATQFATTGRWATVRQIYRRASREFAIHSTFEQVIAMFAASGAMHADMEPMLGLQVLHRCRDVQADMTNFVAAVGFAVLAGDDSDSLTSDDMAKKMGLAQLSVIKLGWLLRSAWNVVRDSTSTADYSTWSYRIAENAHFFKGVTTLDEYLDVERRVSTPVVSSGSNVIPRADEIGADRPLPEELVTFLMTDIEGSTQLWDQHRNDMEVALERHYGLLAAVIESHHGSVIKSHLEGDSVFAVFRKPSNAVAAALNAQRALQSEAWPNAILIRVRMAIHTGEADLRNGDYQGSAVNRCARLRALARGGQVLVSAATHSLVVDSLPEHCELVGGGEHQLRGLARPESVYVLKHPDLADVSEIDGER